MGGAWASLMLADPSWALPLPITCILFTSQQRERWQSISEKQPFVIPTSAPFPVSATSTKIITTIKLMQLIDSPFCDHYSRLGHSLVTAFCVPVISYRERNTWNTSRCLGSVHLAASLNSSLHSGLFSISAGRLYQDVDFSCAVLHALRWGTIFEISEWAVC